MAVESPVDLAGMFDADEFAERAQYAPAGGGPTEGCLVIVDRGQGRGSFDAGTRQAEGSERHLWVRAAEVATVQRDGTFTMVDEFEAPTGEVFTVASLPKLDHTAALWSVELLIGS
jgi:hypothetical protein